MSCSWCSMSPQVIRAARPAGPPASASPAAVWAGRLAACDLAVLLLRNQETKSCMPGKTRVQMMDLKSVVRCQCGLRKRRAAVGGRRDGGGRGGGGAAEAATAAASAPVWRFFEVVSVCGGHT